MEVICWHRGNTYRLTKIWLRVKVIAFGFIFWTAAEIAVFDPLNNNLCRNISEGLWKATYKMERWNDNNYFP